MVVTPLAEIETQAGRPHWGDLVKWQAAQSARRGAVDTGGHLIAGMLPQVDGAGRVSAAEGLCVACAVGARSWSTSPLADAPRSAAARGRSTVPRASGGWTPAARYA